MAVTVDKASASITVDTSGIVPSVHVIPARAHPSLKPHVTSHLSKNFRVVKNGILAAYALKAVGKVKISTSLSDPELDLWSFGFIQFQKVNEIKVVYQGRSRFDGFIVLSPDTPPAMSQNLALDSDDSFFPWTTSSRPTSSVFQPATGEVICRTGDHPMLLVAAQLMNAKTGLPNYLSRLVDDREFWTVFSVIDPNANFLHLAHFHWAVRWDFQFVWRASVPVVTTRNSPFVRDADFLGPPKEEFLQTLLKNPEGPQANVICNLAMQNTGSPSAIGTPNRGDDSDAGTIDPLFYLD